MFSHCLLLYCGEIVVGVCVKCFFPFIIVKVAKFDRLFAGAKEKTKDGRLALHMACAKNAAIEVVNALLAAHPDGQAA